MKIKDLKKELENLDGEMDIFIIAQNIYEDEETSIIKEILIEGKEFNIIIEDYKEDI